MFVCRPGHRYLAAGLALLLSLIGLAPAQPAAANSPPDPPVIESPAAADVPPADVHMEIGAPFRDPDGDTHVATDWEIKRVDQVVWAAYNSPELAHAHFSDGQFQGSLAGKDALRYRTAYLFRVRFQDSRGAWSAWSEREFTTATDSEVPPRRVHDILAQPAPTWRTDGGAALTLPEGARLQLEVASGGSPLLTLGGTGSGLEAVDGASLPAPDILRPRLIAPADAPLTVPSSRLSVIIDGPAGAERLTLYLPAVTLEPGQTRLWWVSETGASFLAEEEQVHSARRLARDTPLPWSVPTDYRLEAIGAAYQLPTSLAFVADPGADPAAPRLYVTELYGRIKVITNDGRVFNFAENLLNVNPSGQFPGSGELGVIGVCLPPAGRDVYATTIYTDPDGSLRNKIIRIRSADGLAATAVEDVLRTDTGRGLARASHQIQQCSFGPDGKLYVFVADGPNPANAQDDESFGGKVLRLNPDGSAPTDNPFYDPARPTAPISYQWTKGHRNAFGQAWRPSTGQLYMSENGTNIDRLVLIEGGRNYGWSGSDEAMKTNAVYVWPQAHWAPVGLDFAEGPKAAALAPDKAGRLFIGTTGAAYAAGPQTTGKAIHDFGMDADGRVSPEPNLFARYVGEGRGTIADLKLQPDGLYFTDLFLDDGVGGAQAPGAKIWRINYTGRANFTASATTGSAPLSVAFNDTSTVTSAGARVWDFGDGQFSADATPTHTFTQPGRYAVSLTRTGADGRSYEHLAIVTVTDATGAAPASAPVPQPLPVAPAPDVIAFPETGTVLGGGFRHYWEAHGGLAQFGYPISNELSEVSPTDGVVRTVQYFERARFEYHPEHKGTPYETELGLLGRQIAASRADASPFQPVADPGDGSWFAETGHTLNGAFREHWQATGGVAIYGFPISEPFQEQAPGEEATLVQYFERARLELPPQNEGAARVWIGRLGTHVFALRPPPRVAS